MDQDDVYDYESGKSLYSKEEYIKMILNEVDLFYDQKNLENDKWMKINIIHF